MEIRHAQNELSAAVKIALATNLVAGYYEHEQHIPNKLKAEISRTRDAILRNMTQPNFNDINTVDLMSLGISDDTTKKQLPAQVRTLVEKIDALQEKEQLFIAKDGNNILGMCGYKNVGKNPKNGTTVFEIAHLSVLPQAQKRGLGKQIQLAIFQHLLKTNNACDILTVSVNPGVQNSTTAMGGEIIDPLLTKTFDDGVPVDQRSAEDRAWAERKTNNGTKFYLMHLDKNTLEKLSISQ